MSGTRKTLKAHMGEGIAPVVRMPEGDETVTFTIDGWEISAPRGTTILQAALNEGIAIPHFCYHPGLSAAGNCRMCLVQVDGRPKLEPSCIIPVADGMEVVSDAENVAAERRAVMEFLLLNHPLDCPWCDKAGECMLQDNTFEYSSGQTRHRMVKRTYPVKDFSDRLKMFSNRCIQCTRCIRFLREIEAGEEFSLYDRGAEVDVGTYLEHNLTNNYQGCLADVCPVGALISKQFLYHSRVFFLEASLGVCTKCSAGCSLYVDRYENRVARVRPRPNLDVNDWWMCDIGRYEWGTLLEDRILVSRRGNGEELDRERALEAALEALKSADGKVAGIVSAAATCEEAYLIGRLIGGAGGTTAVWYGPDGRIDPAEKNDFLHRKDPNPNTLGVEAVLGNTASIDDLLAKIEEGSITTLFILGAGLTDEIAGRLGGLANVVVVAANDSAAVKAASLVLSGTAAFEKSGTFVNGDGRLQRFDQALELPGDALDEITILSHLLAGTGSGEPVSDAAAAFSVLAGEVKAFEGLIFATIPTGGIQLQLGGNA